MQRSDRRECYARRVVSATIHSRSLQTSLHRGHTLVRSASRCLVEFRSTRYSLAIGESIEKKLFLGLFLKISVSRVSSNFLFGISISVLGSKNRVKRNICKIEYRDRWNRVVPSKRRSRILRSIIVVVVDHSSSFESTLAIKYLLIPAARLLKQRSETNVLPM